jgi:hypothetical protein
MTDILGIINPQIFCCEICDFFTSNKKDYNRHLMTPKHKNTYILLTNTYTITQKNPLPLNKYFNCDCGKQYKHRQSLFHHKKICSNYKLNVEKDKTLKEKELIITLLKQNNEIQTQIIELCKEKSITNINNTCGQINSNNKTFNLNLFLNETCKDAMNIMDFVDSLKLQLSDLEKVGQLGYVEGISNIITTNLKALDVTLRPIHCTDKKRETLYIKDEDKWEKDDEKKKIHKVIKRVADKNARLLPKFKEAHPDCIKASSKFSDQYNKIIVESMGGSGDNDTEKEDKIIKNIMKNVTIDK